MSRFVRPDAAYGGPKGRPERHPRAFESKSRIKALDPASFAERFVDRVDRYKNRWDREMRQHLADPSHLKDVVRVVSRRLRAADLI